MKVKIKELECKRCGHIWVPRSRGVRLCPSCKTAFWNVSPIKESDQHTTMKEVARKFLKDLGCDDIATEYTCGKNGRWSKGYVRFDVVGWLDGKMVAVECGSIQEKAKLRKVKALLNTKELAILYILPYGYVMPYEWRPGISFCPRCGHKW